jgi:flagellar M-ring protein FliF
MERLITWFSRQWATLGPSQKVSFVTIGLLLVVATIIAVTMLMTPDWQTLYGELSPQDAGAMRAKLSDLGIASRVNASGTVIEVPSAQVGRARIELASAGLPKDQVGLEILRNPPLGATQETIKDMRQMGLQGELSRTFRALDSVRYASVQLVLPEEGLFAEQNREATAVVVLGLRPGASLDSRQIAGMVHLLTHSIPELKPENVSITDTSRGLLAIGSDYASGAAGYGVPLTEMQEARQKSYEKQVQGLLDTAFGAGNSRVAVHLEMDLTKKDTKKTVHTPVGTTG